MLLFSSYAIITDCATVYANPVPTVKDTFPVESIVIVVVESVAY